MYMSGSICTCVVVLMPDDVMPEFGEVLAWLLGFAADLRMERAVCEDVARERGQQTMFCTGECNERDDIMKLMYGWRWV